MIIIDTSVWIEFFKGNADYFSEIRSYIENQKVLAHEPIFAELLQGVRNQREKEIIHQYWKFLPHTTIDQCWIQAGILSYERKLTSFGVGLIDSCILVAAMDTSSTIWSLDKKLLGVTPDELVFKQSPTQN